MTMETKLTLTVVMQLVKSKMVGLALVTLVKKFVETFTELEQKHVTMVTALIMRDV